MNINPTKGVLMVKITVDGIDYYPASVTNVEGLPYVVVRSATASPFAGYLESQTPTTCVLVQARRIRYWDGAMDLSQLANDGTTKPDKCKFSAPELRVEVPWSEIHACSPAGAASIQGVPPWKI